jgi:uncharacterized protein (TIGR00725 family)
MLTWQEDTISAPSTPDAAPASPREALLYLAQHTPLRRVPIGIIGPREATAAQLDTARALGGEFARHGLQLLCGGRSGVMEAACRGHAESGGQPIGLLPDDEWHSANPYVAIPIATGIGPARNAIIARSCLVLVAVGGGVGTLSEMALGLQFGRLVLALEGAPPVAGVPELTDISQVMDRIAARLLSL